MAAVEPTRSSRVASIGEDFWRIIDGGIGTKESVLTDGEVGVREKRLLTDWHGNCDWRGGRHLPEGAGRRLLG